ncbi:MAG: TetR family transcriptional regulator [Novosphingobium sp.]
MDARTTLPRKRDSAATRARILAAAQRAFSETGYSHTGIRDVARLAGTSPTLVLRYFRSKAGLFEAALTAAMPVESVFAHPRAALGRGLAEALLDPANEIRPPLMIALAAGDPEAAAIAARVFEAQSIAPLAEWLGGPDGRARALEIAMLATGLVSYLRQLPLNPVNEAERRHISDWFAQAVQAIVAQGESVANGKQEG